MKSDATKMSTWSKVCGCFAMAFIFAQSISSLLGSSVWGFLTVMTWAVLMTVFIVWGDRRRARQNPATSKNQ
jgi:hypothetical protein